MNPAGRHIARETILSALINGAISIAFFVFVFGSSEMVPVWGIGAYAFDFLPQSFAIGLMGSLVPALLARKAALAGRLGGFGHALPSVGRIVVRALRNALAALLVGGGMSAAILWLSGAEEIARNPAFTIKVAYGALLGALVTRVMLLDLLGREDRPS